MHKTRLTQNKKAKRTSNPKTKTRREKKWLNHLEPFSFNSLEEPFCFANPWSGGEGKELKPFKFDRNIRALSRSPRGAKEDGNWFWFLDEIILLLCWVASHLWQLGQVCPVAPQWWQRCYLFCLDFWEFLLLALGFLISFLSSLGGTPKIDLPLSMFSLVNSIFNIIVLSFNIISKRNKNSSTSRSNTRKREIIS